jgi:glycogen synthase
LAEQPHTKFLIVGGGHRERFESFVRWYGLENKVLFTGFMANRSLHQLYRVADVAVFPSLYEPFGIVALEGMAAGAPVVASDAGGLKEVVLHDKTGTTSFAGDPGSLAWAILRTLKDPQRSHALSHAAKERLKTDFDWGRIASQTIETYERVWREFLGSYWADKTLWPVSPGADERARQLKVTEKALTGAFASRPARPTAIAAPAEKISADEALAQEVDAAD